MNNESWSMLVSFVYTFLDFLLVIAAIVTLARTVTAAQFVELRIVVAVIGWLLVPTMVSRFREMVDP